MFQDMINRAESVLDLLNRVFINNESWFYWCDPETKWKEIGHVRKKKLVECEENYVFFKDSTWFNLK